MDKIKKAKRVEQADRVSYGMSRKVNLGNYESIDTHISYSSDVVEGEDFGSALKRIAKKVDKAMDKREKLMRKAAKS